MAGETGAYKLVQYLRLRANLIIYIMKKITFLLPVVFACLAANAQDLFPQNKRVYTGSINVSSQLKDDATGVASVPKSTYNGINISLGLGKFKSERKLKGFSFYIGPALATDQYNSASGLRKRSTETYAAGVSRFNYTFLPLGKSGFNVFYSIVYSMGLSYSSTYIDKQFSGESFGEQLSGGLAGGLSYKLTRQFMANASVSLISASVNVTHYNRYFQYSMNAGSSLGLGNLSSVNLSLFWCPGAKE